MATFKELSQNRDFIALDPLSKRQVLDASDPNFSALDDVSKEQIIGTLPQVKAEIKEAAFPGMGQFPEPTRLQKAQDVLAAGTFGLESALGKVPGALANLAVMGSPALQIASSLSPSLNEKIQGAVSATEDLTPKAYRAVGIDPFNPENPQFQYPVVSEIGEFGTEAATIFTGGGAAKKVTKGPETVGKVERFLRSAIKPKNETVGSGVERALKEELPDLFARNPNADTSSEMAFEGFFNTVRDSRKNVGSQISQVQARIGETIPGGDRIAAALNKKADALEKAGESASDIQFLRGRAADFSGKVTDIDSIQDATTLANLRRSPFFQRARAAQDPSRASVEGIVNEIISKEGGDVINEAMEKVGGEQAAALRKKWSNLNILEKNSHERLSKIINAAPPEVQSQAANALTSLEGVAGLFSIASGNAAGIIPLASAAVKSYARKASKELKSPNALVEKAYKELRKRPPAAPEPFILPPSLQQPPPIPASLNEVIARSIVPPGTRVVPENELERLIQTVADREGSSVGNF